MLLKSPIFLVVILGVSIIGGLVLGVSCLKERWEPRIEYLDSYLPVDPDKTEFVFGGGGYLNEKCEYHCMIYTSWSAKRFRVTIESFSKELQVLDGNKTVGAVPHILQEGNLPEERCIWLGFAVILPNQTGTYEVKLSITLFGSLFSRGYKWKYMLRAEPFVPKSLPEEYLCINLDEETYRQGDIMTITIENISNETIEFGNAAYDVCFERFTGEYWEFYDSIPSAAVITYLEQGQIGQVTWKLDEHTGHPFPAGQYRVWVHGVYAEFEVVEAELSEAELETIIIEFLKTTDVADVLWEDRVEIIEVYDHKLGGKVLVVNYTTINAGHPYFALEALEDHTAVITLSEEGEVISAFCVWGSFHDSAIWDLVNQRWIQK